MPSSLRRVISSAFPYYGHLPVSDYGTIDYDTDLRVFLGSLASVTSLWRTAGSPSPLIPTFIGTTGLDEDVQHLAHLAFCVIPSS
jgi:hypothetical protein